MHDTHSHYALSFCEVSSDLLQCDLDREHRNLTLVPDTPSHYVLSFCEVLLNLLQ